MQISRNIANGLNSNN